LIRGRSVAKLAIMENILTILSVVVALGIFNVWVLRFRQPTSWRGGDAKSMKEEFAVYGLPDWILYVVGGLKLGLAGLLIAAIWFPAARPIGGGGLAALMGGALVMHVRVKDPARKSAPAVCMLAMSLALALIQ